MYRIQWRFAKDTVLYLVVNWSKIREDPLSLILDVWYGK